MDQDLNQKIINQFKWYYEKGYITARDGNAAYRMSTHFVVTASGSVKNDLLWNDFCLIDLDGNYVPGEPYNKKPSIETGAHIAALKQSGKSASVHVHSPNTVALAALFEPLGGFRPQANHLIDVLNNKWPELFRYTKVGHIVPFIDPGSSKLHDSIVSSLGRWEEEPIYGPCDGGGFDVVEVREVKKWNDICIMQKHGVLAIGDTMDQCMEHIVRLEHISTILLKIITASGKLESIL